MKDHELDRAIDAATQNLVAREPSRALRHNVMARVREAAAPAPSRLRWVAADGERRAVRAMAIALMSRGPAAVFPPLPPARSVAVAQPVVAPTPPIPVPPATAARRIAPAPIAVRAALTATPPSSDVSPIAPIETEPIVLPTLDVPLLEQRPL